MWCWFICFKMLRMTTSRWRILQSPHWIKGLTTAQSICCTDPYVLAHFCPSPPVSVSSLRHHFSTMLTQMCRRLVWSMFPLIRRSSVFWCVSAANHPSLAIHWPFYPVSPPIRQNGFSLIVHGSFLHPVCYIDSPPLSLFFSSSSRFQAAAPVLCTHLHRSLSINLGRGFLSITLPLSLSCHPFFSFYLSLYCFVFSCLPLLQLTIPLNPHSPYLPLSG